jgi:hypothetical protein
VANSEAPRIDARDQFAENFRCLSQGTRGVLDDGRPGCASVIIHHSICAATAHETIYQNSALASPLCIGHLCSPAGGRRTFRDP